MDVNAINDATGQSRAPSTASSFGELASDDFLQLMITQLTNQDPLEPTGNQELLDQISSIRDIELSSSLTSSLQALTGQQNYSSASALIGRYVGGGAGAGREAVSGIVVGVRFEGDGAPVLQLAGGVELAADQVVSIQDARLAGESLVGQNVVGVDRRPNAAERLVEGIVAGVRVDDRGDVILELASGDDLRLRDVASNAVYES